MEPSFVIDINAVRDGFASWTFPVPKEWCAHQFRDCEFEPTDPPGTLELDASKTGEGYLVRGRVRLVLSGTCVRCLAPVPIPVDARFEALWVRGPSDAEPARKSVEAVEDEIEAVDDAPDVEHYRGHEIVLDRYIRDTVLLEIPMNPRCPVPCGTGAPGTVC